MHALFVCCWFLGAVIARNSHNRTVKLGLIFRIEQMHHKVKKSSRLRPTLWDFKPVSSFSPLSHPTFSEEQHFAPQVPQRAIHTRKGKFHMSYDTWTSPLYRCHNLCHRRSFFSLRSSRQDRCMFSSSPCQWFGWSRRGICCCHFENSHLGMMVPYWLRARGWVDYLDPWDKVHSFHDTSHLRVACHQQNCLASRRLPLSSACW